MNTALLAASYAALPRSQPAPELPAVKTRAFGLWEARLLLPDGREIVGHGPSVEDARCLARIRARQALGI